MLVALQLVGVAGVPLNKTLPVPWLAPKLDPLMVTTVPVSPKEGLKFVMFGDGVTVKLTPLLAEVPTVTITLPVVAPLGTLVTMLVSLQLVPTTGMPLKVMELNPFVAPKLDPFIVNDVPTGPDEGVKLVMTGKTLNDTGLLEMPPTVTTTLPDTVPAGTGATMLVVLQLVGVASVPLKLTLLVPCAVPKPVPVIVTGVPTAPERGPMLTMLGVTEKFTPLLATDPTVTTTLPLVAPGGSGATMLVTLQLVGVASVPLKPTVLVPCAAPKPVPVIVTGVPTPPTKGLMLAMLGMTEKLTALLATEPMVTTTLPLVAKEGTGATMLVLLQLVGLVPIPLKVTELPP